MINRVFRNAAFWIALGVAVPGIASAQSNMDNQKSSDQMSSDKMSSGKMGKTGSLSASDRTFIKKAAQGGMAEVQLGKLATEKGSSEDVKKFGQRMVDDHSKANDQLKQLAASKGVDVPTSLNSKDEATKDRLSKLSGSAFDRAYMQDMVKDHTQDVSEFKKASQTAKDPDVKSWAAQTLPTLENHLKTAKSVTPEKTTASVK
jgi:putative membrane protein